MASSIDEKAKNKRKNKLYFERRFELEFDNIENIEQVESLLNQVVSPPSDYIDLLIDTSKENADILHFTMQGGKIQLDSEAQLARNMLIISKRSGATSLHFGFITYPIILVLLFSYPLTLLLFTAEYRTVECLCVFALIGLIGIVISPMMHNGELVRQLETVFREGTSNKNST